MKFKETYTTEALKSADKEGKEASKTVVSNDAFLQAEMIDALINKIEQSRITSLNMRR